MAMGKRPAGAVRASQTRPPRPAWPRQNEFARRIKAGAVLQCLQEHALGQRKMGTLQIKAPLFCCARGLPDLALLI